MHRLGFALLPTLLLTACHITNYELITDNDQVANGSGSGVVNTAGKAHIRESSQLALVFPDGADESISFVDQKSNGDRTLTTYNNYSTSLPYLHDDLYCNPDWQGCAVLTSDDPEVGDEDIFDYTYNRHCSGARSFDLLVSSTRYSGECGRARMSLEDRIRLLNYGRIGSLFGLDGLFYDLDWTNFTILLDNGEGFRTSLPIYGSAEVFVAHPERRGTIDLTHPGNAATLRAYADYLRDHGRYRTDVTLRYNGIEFRVPIAGRRENLSNERTVLELANRSF